MGRWSRAVARGFLEWLAPAPHSLWLDVGCGTGALTELVATAASPRWALGVDSSPDFAAHASAHRIHPTGTYLVADAQALPLAGETFDLAVSGLVLNFVPSPARAVAEMVRVVRQGGTVAVYVWDYAEGMEFLRLFWDAASALDPTAAELDEGRRFPLCRPGALLDLFRAAGLEGVKVRALDVFTPFSDFDDLWRPFLGGQGPAPSYVRSLGEEAREALRERLRAAVRVHGDACITLRARAWAVRASRMAGPAGLPRPPSIPT